MGPLSQSPGGIRYSTLFLATLHYQYVMMDSILLLCYISNFHDPVRNCAHKCSAAPDQNFMEALAVCLCVKTTGKFSKSYEDIGSTLQWYDHTQLYMSGPKRLFQLTSCDVQCTRPSICAGHSYTKLLIFIFVLIVFLATDVFTMVVASGGSITNYTCTA